MMGVAWIYRRTGKLLQHICQLIFASQNNITTAKGHSEQGLKSHDFRPCFLLDF